MESPRKAVIPGQAYAPLPLNSFDEPALDQVANRPSALSSESRVVDEEQKTASKCERCVAAMHNPSTSPAGVPQALNKQLTDSQIPLQKKVAVSHPKFSTAPKIEVAAQQATLEFSEIADELKKIAVDRFTIVLDAILSRCIAASVPPSKKK